MTALYVGGMGAKGKNFYNNIFRKYGYESEAEQIQDLYLDGKKDEAMAALSDSFTADIGRGCIKAGIIVPDYFAPGLGRIQVLSFEANFIVFERREGKASNHDGTAHVVGKVNALGYFASTDAHQNCSCRFGLGQVLFELGDGRGQIR